MAPPMGWGCESYAVDTVKTLVFDKPKQPLPLCAHQDGEDFELWAADLTKHRRDEMAALLRASESSDEEDPMVSSLLIGSFI